MMESSIRRLWAGSSLTGIIVLMILMAALVALAASDISSLVSTREQGAANGRTVQQPLGEVTGENEVEQERGGGGGVLTTVAPGGGAGGAGAGAGAGGGSLPFAGFVAIPVLLAGAALIAAGVAIRSRAVGPPPST
jgi:hypothetical protein